MLLGAVGATAAPLVGLVAERTFGFSGTLDQGVDAAHHEALLNAHALGNAMLVLLLLPWGFDFFVYFGESSNTHQLHHIAARPTSDVVSVLCWKGRLLFV